jgi:hypothetical protein
VLIPLAVRIERAAKLRECTRVRILGKRRFVPGAIDALTLFVPTAIVRVVCECRGRAQPECGSARDEES